MRRGMLMAGMLLALAAPARGDVKLEWKFKADDHFYAEEVTVLKVVLDGGAGVKTETETETTVVYAFTVKQADKDGTVIDEKIESIKSNSKKGDAAGKLDRALESLRGAVFTLTLNRDNQVTKLEGYDEALKKLPPGDETAAKLLRAAFSEEAVRQGASQLFGSFPAKSLAEGARWERERAIPLGPVGVFVLKTVYTYKGKGKDGEEIWLETTAAYQPPKDAGAGFKVLKSELKGEAVKGQIVFDADTGRLVREETGAKLAGPLTLEINGREKVVTVLVDQSRKLRVSDKPPQ